MTFPISLDNLTNPDPTSNQSVLVHSTQHTLANNAIEAIENSVGITNSTDVNSLRYMQERLTTKGDILVHNGTNYIRLPVGANGYQLVADSTESAGLKYIPTTAGGTVTTLSVTGANGFAGTVANATTTPAITLTTSVTGILKGNGTAISAATAGTDYSTPTGVETLTNKTLTSPAVNSPTIATPIINIGSDANGDTYYRNAGTTKRLAIGSENLFNTSDGAIPQWNNPFTYTGTVVNDSISVDGTGDGTTTSRQTNNLTTANVSLVRGTSGYSRVEYSPDNSTWTTIITVTGAGSSSFPLLLRKGYYYRIAVNSTIGGTPTTGSINYVI